MVNLRDKIYDFIMARTKFSRLAIPSTLFASICVVICYIMVSLYLFSELSVAILEAESLSTIIFQNLNLKAIS